MWIVFYSATFFFFMNQVQCLHWMIFLVKFKLTGFASSIVGPTKKKEMCFIPSKRLTLLMYHSSLISLKFSYLFSFFQYKSGWHYMPMHIICSHMLHNQASESHLHHLFLTPIVFIHWHLDSYCVHMLKPGPRFSPCVEAHQCWQLQWGGEMESH